MAILDPLYLVYDALFQPLLLFGGMQTGGILTIALISTIISIILTLAHKYLVDQNRKQEIKDKIEKYKKKIEKARENDNMETAQKYMSESLSQNKEMMKLTLKPMALSLVLVLLIFPWLSHTFTQPIVLEQTDNNTYGATFSYLGAETQLTAQEVYSDEFDETRLVVEANGKKLKPGDTVAVGTSNWEIKKFSQKENSEPVVTTQLSFITFALPTSIPLIGKNLEWLGFYILLSIPLTFGLRKLLNVD